MRRVLLVVDWFLTILFAISMVGLIVVFLGLGDDLDILIFLWCWGYHTGCYGS